MGRGSFNVCDSEDRRGNSEKGAGSHFVKLTPTQQQSIISLAQNAKQTINDGKYVATWSELELNVYQESTAFTYTQVFHRTLKSARIVDVRIDSSSNLVQVVVSLRDHRIKLAESALDGAPHGECTWDKIEAPPTESPPSLNGPRPTVSNCGLIAAQTVQAKIFGHFLANCNDTHMLDIYDLTNAAKWLKVAAPNPYLDATVDTKVPTSSVVMCTNFFSTSDAKTLGVRQNRAHIGFLHQTSAGALEAQSVIHPDAKDSTPSVTPTPPTPDAKPNAGTTVDLPPPGPSSTPQPPTSN